MGKKDISFKNEELQIKFNFRVAGIFVGNNKILLQKSSKDEYYSLIGGRVNYFENTKEAFIREVEEETGVVLQNDEVKLIDVVENFFIYDNTKFHELLFIYKVINNEKLMNMDNFKTIDKDTTVNKWVDISDLDKYNIMPSLVKNIINNDKIDHDIVNDY